MIAHAGRSEHAWPVRTSELQRRRRRFVREVCDPARAMAMSFDPGVMGIQRTRRRIKEGTASISNDSVMSAKVSASTCLPIDS